VLHIELSGGKHLLLPGDVESGAERVLVSSLSHQELHSDVMLMPHHGSNTSSSQAFLTAVSPTFAVAQSGFANRYGFPAPEVKHRYAELGTRVLNTAKGAVIIDFDAQGAAKVQPVPVIISPKRKLALQWWHHLL